MTHKSHGMGDLDTVKRASDAAVRAVGGQAGEAEQGATALAVALARVCVAAGVDLEGKLRVARFVADALEGEAC